MLVIYETADLLASRYQFWNQHSNRHALAVAQTNTAEEQSDQGQFWQGQLCTTFQFFINRNSTEDEVSC